MPRQDQGISSDRFRIIPRVLIFLVRGNRLLLIRGSPQKRLWANKYNGIGGHIERGEDVLTAARRELLEETGIQSATLQLCGTVMIDAGETTGIGLYVFSGETDQEQLIPSREGMLEWVAIQQVMQLPLVEDLPVLIPRVLAVRQGGPSFHARYSYNDAEELIIEFGD